MGEDAVTGQKASWREWRAWRREFKSLGIRQVKEREARSIWHGEKQQAARFDIEVGDRFRQEGKFRLHPIQLGRSPVDVVNAAVSKPSSKDAACKRQSQPEPLPDEPDILLNCQANCPKCSDDIHRR